MLGSRLRIEQTGTVSPQSRGHLGGLQAGTDLWVDDPWRVGVYLGQLDSDFDVQGFAQGLANATVGGNALRSRYLGVYANRTRADGLYVDAVLQSAQHRYTVRPVGNPNANAKAASLSSSIEIGQTLPLQEGWQVEPQLQLVYQRMDFDAVDIAGAQVRQRARGSWLGRVGVRIKGDMPIAAGRLRPYANFNLYRATGGHDSAHFINPSASTAIATRSGSSAAELAVGFALALGADTSVHAGLARTWALGGHEGVRSHLQGSLGLRVRW